MLSKRVVQRFVLCGVGFATLLATSPAARGEINRWDTGEMIPGTEGIVPGPGVQLDALQLEYADFVGHLALADATFRDSNLTNAHFYGNDLTGAVFNGSDLTNAVFLNATLTSADFSGAMVNGTRFVFYGFSIGDVLGPEQLYSTASYQRRNLQQIKFEGVDLSDWNFSGQDLTDANFSGSNLGNVDFTGATVTGANFEHFSYSGLAKEQLYTTESYSQRNLRGINLSGLWLTSVDLSGQNLTNARFIGARLMNANLAEAVVGGADFSWTTSEGFAEHQLYSTRSFSLKDLQGIHLAFNDLSGWNLNGQDLSNASLRDSTLTDTDLSRANLVNVNFWWAVGTGANLKAADLRGAVGLSLRNPLLRNAIRSDGRILGLDLIDGETLVIRDDDGVPDPLPIQDPIRDWLQWRPPLPIIVHDHLTMAQGGVLRLEFESDPWDSLVAFQAGIPVQLGGTLELTFANGVEVSSQIGRTLRVFDWTGVSPTGAFDIDSPYLWNLTRLYSSGEVTLLAVPEPYSAWLLLCSLGAVVYETSRQARIVRHSGCFQPNPNLTSLEVASAKYNNEGERQAIEPCLRW